MRTENSNGNESLWRWDELQRRREIPVGAAGGRASLKVRRDAGGATLHEIELHNGALTFTVLPERGLDIGEIVLDGEKMSWERGDSCLLHPDRVDLTAGGGTGWLQGFYAAVASIGPELFGTPGEGYTLHGTGSYSPADLRSIAVWADEEGLTFEGSVSVVGYGERPQFGKRVRLFTRWGSECLLREETTTNLSDRALTLDDGYHVQLCGPFLHEGGRYVLPVSSEAMLLRDNAPPEEDPLRIPPISEGLSPIRCYQYVPEAVRGLEERAELRDYVEAMPQRAGFAAEMVVNASGDAAGYVIRPLSAFPRSLIAKEISEYGFMFALEPCRTRPNRMSQKHTDGEAFILPPGGSDTTQCLIGVTQDRSLIGDLEKKIHRG
ncbi:DUF4432 family protein [Cohnella candidum]|nr:DUF4432 family protein [Cohnella candidum]